MPAQPYITLLLVEVKGGQPEVEKISTELFDSAVAAVDRIQRILTAKRRAYHELIAAVGGMDGAYERVTYKRMLFPTVGGARLSLSRREWLGEELEGNQSKLAQSIRQDFPRFSEAEHLVLKGSHAPTLAQHERDLATVTKLAAALENIKDELRRVLVPAALMTTGENEIGLTIKNKKLNKRQKKLVEVEIIKQAKAARRTLDVIGGRACQMVVSLTEEEARVEPNLGVCRYLNSDYLETLP